MGQSFLNDGKTFTARRLKQTRPKTGGGPSVFD